MPFKIRWPFQLKDRLTIIFYIMVLGRHYLRTDDVQLRNGEHIRALVFSSQERPFGQHTVFNTIIVHDEVFACAATDFILLHEVGHVKQWYSYLVIAPIVYFIGLSLKNYSWYGLVIGLISLGLFSWFIEFDADFYAISQFGIKEYRKESRRIRAIAHKYTWWERLPSYLMGPRSGLSLRLYEYLHRSSRQD